MVKDLGSRVQGLEIGVARSGCKHTASLPCTYRSTFPVAHYTTCSWPASGTASRATSPVIGSY